MGKALHNLRRASNDPWTAHRLPGPRRHKSHPVDAMLCLRQPTDDTPAEHLLRSARLDQGHSIDAVLCLRHGPEVKILNTRKFCRAEGHSACFYRLYSRQPNQRLHWAAEVIGRLGDSTRFPFDTRPNASRLSDRNYFPAAEKAWLET